MKKIAKIPLRPLASRWCSDLGKFLIGGCTAPAGTRGSAGSGGPCGVRRGGPTPSADLPPVQRFAHRSRAPIVEGMRGATAAKCITLQVISEESTVAAGREDLPRAPIASNVS